MAFIGIGTPVSLQTASDGFGVRKGAAQPYWKTVITQYVFLRSYVEF